MSSPIPLSAAGEEPEEASYQLQLEGLEVRQMLTVSAYIVSDDPRNVPLVLNAVKPVPT